MRATLVLLSAIALVFVLQLAIGGFTDAFVLDSSELAARPWTLLTAMFLHGDFAHLFYNAFALALFGFILEGIIGTRRLLIVYFAGGLVASAVAAVFYAATLGASGAIFAILGTLAVLRPRMTVWVAYLPLPMAVAALVWVAIDLFGFIAPSGIANAAHIAGLVFGVAAGFAMRKDFGAPFRRRAARKLSETDAQKWENEWM